MRAVCAFHKDPNFFKRNKIIMRKTVLMHCGKRRTGREAEAGKAGKGPDCSLKCF